MADLIDRQKAIDAIAEFLFYTSNFDGMRQGFDLSDWKWKIEGVLSDLPSSQPTQTNTPNTLDALDCVSRQAAIDALRVAYWDDNIQSAKDDPCIVDAMTDWAIRQVKALPSAQPEFAKDTNFTTNDLIDRQAAIDEIARWIGYIDEDMILRIQTGLKKVPSAQPERKTGKWIYLNGLDAFECSVCGRQMVRNIFDYCPWCGAEMTKGEEDE